MASQGPPDPWPPPYPTSVESSPDSSYGASDRGGRSRLPNAGRIWAIALAAAVPAYGLLLVLQMSMESSASAAFQAGEIAPIAGVTAVVVALLALSTSTGRAWRWWAITLVVLGASSTWYAVVEVLPRATEGLRTEARGGGAYTLETPQRAGDWIRMDGAAVARREAQTIAAIEQAPDEIRSGMGDVVYGEYRTRGQGRLAFVGFDASGELEGDLREATSAALRDFMAGAEATDPQPVDPGRLGGSMACAGGARGLPAGYTYCAWADATTLGQVTIADTGLDLEQVAEIIRGFRDHVTRPQ